VNLSILLAIAGGVVLSKRESGGKVNWLEAFGEVDQINCVEKEASGR